MLFLVGASSVCVCVGGGGGIGGERGGGGGMYDFVFPLALSEFDTLADVMC